MSKAIELNAVSKAYRLRRQTPFLAKEIFRRVLQRPSKVDLHWALKDVSFEVGRGESMAVIGNNGSGKSTLLSLIAKTSYPTAGTVTVRGRVGPLLELGAGFHPDLTGYENIYLNASLLGLSREELESKLDSIIEYSGLDDFVYSPIQTYSTGMLTRLGFAVIAHIEPDILLVDEVLAVGDAEFQSKCQATIRQFIQQGSTLFFVSHSMPTVLELCERAIWLEKGEVQAFDKAQVVVEQYQAHELAKLEAKD
ncbi:MAG: ABC transporter ATP-binding protein [Planctomycetota bacterium]|jgi:ABC-2 type transport system ATP-binding protein